MKVVEYLPVCGQARGGAGAGRVVNVGLAYAGLAPGGWCACTRPCHPSVRRQLWRRPGSALTQAHELGFGIVAASAGAR